MITNPSSTHSRNILSREYRYKEVLVYLLYGKGHQKVKWDEALARVTHAHFSHMPAAEQKVQLSSQAKILDRRFSGEAGGQQGEGSGQKSFMDRAVSSLLDRGSLPVPPSPTSPYS